MKFFSTLGLRFAFPAVIAVSVFPSEASAEPPVVPMAAWKSTYYAPSQIAAGLADDLTAPTADGTSNLLKYAYGLTPFEDASSFSPQVNLVGNSLILEYRRLSAATDLSYEVEASSDLKTWTSGADTIEELTRLNLSSGIDLVTVRDRQVVDASRQRFLRLRVTRSITDTSGNGMSDDWQIQNFGQLGVDPDGDPDGDGVSNRTEFIAGTDPNDTFDGHDLVVRPLLTPAGQLLPGGEMRVWVGRSDGRPLRNAEITFTIEDTFNFLVDGTTATQEISVRTDGDGCAHVFLTGTGTAGGC